MSSSVLITGANRGIGLGLVKEFLARDYRVFASCREPQRARELNELAVGYGKKLHVHACDVMSDDSVVAWRDAVTGHTGELDIVVNNAGILPPGDERIDEVGIDTLRRTLETNALGAFRIVQAFLPFVRRGREKKFVHISSKMGSVSLNTAAGAYSYRMSKAALNMLSRNLAIELRSESIISVALHPGWAQTDMGGAGASVPLRDSLRGLMAVIENAGPRESGEFYNYTGDPLAY